MECDFFYIRETRFTLNIKQFNIEQFRYANCRSTLTSRRYRT